MRVRIVATMLPAAERFGIATAAEVELDTLGARLRAETQARHAVVWPPTLAGAWTRVP
jgi:hypothetical protein